MSTCKYIYYIVVLDSNGIYNILVGILELALKTLLQQGISGPIFYGDLVHKFKRIVGKPYFGDQFKNIIKLFIKVEYSLDVMRQTACLV